MSQDAIIDFLDEVFDGLKVDAVHDESAARTVFHIEVDAGVEMLLAISDGCFGSQPINDIEAVIESHAKSLMHQNHNAVVAIGDDLACSLS